MSIKTLPKSSPPATDQGDDLDHYWCDCRGPFVALCGARLGGSDADFDDDGPNVCVVCLDYCRRTCDCDDQVRA